MSADGGLWRHSGCEFRLRCVAVEQRFDHDGAFLKRNTSRVKFESDNDLASFILETPASATVPHYTIGAEYLFTISDVQVAAAEQPADREPE